MIYNFKNPPKTEAQIRSVISVASAKGPLVSKFLMVSSLAPVRPCPLVVCCLLLTWGTSAIIYHLYHQSFAPQVSIHSTLLYHPMILQYTISTTSHSLHRSLLYSTLALPSSTISTTSHSLLRWQLYTTLPSYTISTTSHSLRRWLLYSTLPSYTISTTSHSLRRWPVYSTLHNTKNTKNCPQPVGKHLACQLLVVKRTPSYCV